jgi:hypothetical protein
MGKHKRCFCQTLSKLSTDSKEKLKTKFSSSLGLMPENEAEEENS